MLRARSGPLILVLFLEKLPGNLTDRPVMDGEDLMLMTRGGV
jgi:hypothetical protein